MILRSPRRELFALLYVLLDISPLLVYSQADFDCHLTVNDAKFDLTSLAGEHVINRTRSTPPTTMIDSLRFNLCADLKQIDGLAGHDQCSSGTRACLTKVNVKEHEPDRITAVIPIAQSSNLDLTSSLSHEPKSLSLQLQGAIYSGSSMRQSLNMTLFCDPDKPSAPEFVAYDGIRLDLAWHTPAGCSFQEAPKDDDKKEDKPHNEPKGSIGSGIGWFFLVILLALLAYFCLGAYYNYTTYGATGLDLIPHRDFWQEVPYMLNDVISHLCSSARPRRSTRSGYIAV